MFQELERINERPEIFEFYTAADLWTDKYTSAQMLSLHLDAARDVSSRNAQFINRSVEWIASRFRIGKGTKVADFGCGPGLYANELARRGADVTGIDFSSRSIEYAKAVATREQLNVKYVTQNYLDFETDERFDLVLMIMCDFCALSYVQRRVILSRFQKILHPGGSVLLDVYSMRAFDQRDEALKYEVSPCNGFWSPDKYFCFQNTFKYAAEHVILDKYTIVDSKRTRTVFNWLQHFSPETLTRECIDGGFSVEELRSDVAGTPYDASASEFAVVARR